LIHGRPRQGANLSKEPLPALRREAEVVHREESHRERQPEQNRTHDVRDAEMGGLRQEPSPHGSDQHRDAGNHLPASEDGIELAFESGKRERVDEPGFGRPGKEGETEAKENGCNRPPKEMCVRLPHGEIEQRRKKERDCAEQEGDAPSAGVGEHAGGHLEEDLACGEERVHAERLGVGEPRIEEKERVDPPDERRRQRRQKREQEVGRLDAACPRVHHAVLRADTSVAQADQIPKGPERSLISPKVLTAQGGRLR
jgi:hypothetical protein